MAVRFVALAILLLGVGLLYRAFRPKCMRIPLLWHVLGWVDEPSGLRRVIGFRQKIAKLVAAGRAQIDILESVDKLIRRLISRGVDDSGAFRQQITDSGDFLSSVYGQLRSMGSQTTEDDEIQMQQEEISRRVGIFAEIERL